MKGLGKEKTISGQIVSGYLLLTGVVVFLILVSILSLVVTVRGYSSISACQDQRIRAQEVITAHYKWLEQLSDSITTGAEFQGGLDPNACALGKWINESGDEMHEDAVMGKALDGMIKPHEDLHLTATELIELSKNDKEAAYELYGEAYKPKVEAVGSGLTAISTRYQEIADGLSARTHGLTMFCTFLLILVGAGAVVVSLGVGKKVAKRISNPVKAVEKWSEDLATGIDNLEFDEKAIENEQNPAEIKQMIRSFQRMTNGIRDNVRVIQKVASGDLTAYVDIKSDGDSLGRNLYHLVQNNDHMFGKLLQIADSVASNADHIAVASQALADSSTSQADAIDVLSTTVKQSNSLATQNADSASDASSMIQAMDEAVQLGRQRMEVLLTAVDEIRQSSEKISVVMKSINDIAFQTNILALNAAVEAARAGAAGKGFAVVADEVRNLANKSSEAADQSRLLIENTISKTAEGNKVAMEASDSFTVIVDKASKVTDMIGGINSASVEQQRYMAEIDEEIGKITAIITQNAASSEETAAATQQMNANAELIRSAMRKFNLRKRIEGQPYIPPEKADDPDFIRIAQENYMKAKGSRS